MKLVITNVDESSDRVLAGRWLFDRPAGGILQLSAESLFPTSTYARELVWNVASGAFYVRNDFNTGWRLAADAPVTADYITLGSTGSLINERVLTSTPSILVSDLGANLTVNLAIRNAAVATVSGTTFTGPVIASTLSGTLQRTSSNTSFIVNGSGVLVTTNSAGQLIISNSMGAISGADNMASYLTLNATSSLFNERLLSTSGSSLTLTDAGAGSLASLSLNTTGSAMTTNGYGVAVNSRGFVTSGSTSYFGKDFRFITGSYAQPFSNATTTYLSALTLTASNLSPGIYRLGWNFTYRYNLATTSFVSRIFILNSASFEHIEEPSGVGANERYMICGSTYVRITGSVALFAIEARAESGTTTCRLYDRALELWRVS